MQENVSKSQDTRDWLLAVAFVYLQQNHFEKAVVLLEVTTKLYADDPYVIRGLAFAYLKTQRHREALALCDRSLKAQGIHLGTAPFLLLRCRALWALERPDEARKSLRKYHQLTGSPAK